MRFLLVLSLGLILSSCTKKESGPSSESKAQRPFRVGLVLDKGGKDDKSFNSAAFAGATRAAQELGVLIKDVESPDDNAFEPALRTFAERGLDLIIGIGFSQMDAVKKVAPQFPNSKFAIIDAVVDLPNVASLMFAEHEGSFLVGYLAGLHTKSWKVGFIGGMDIALIRRFQLGFEEGVKAANSKAQVIVNYAGITSDAWANPSRGKELALSQISRGADVIFHAAGATGMGVFDAVEEKQKFAIGVDSNQNWVKPGRVLSSMLKRVDIAVFEIIRKSQAGQFAAGTQNFGLKDKGIDYAVDEHNQALIAPHKEKLEKVREDILSGKIKVSDYYLTRKAN